MSMQLQDSLRFARRVSTGSELWIAIKQLFDTEAYMHLSCKSPLRFSRSLDERAWVVVRWESDLWARPMSPPPLSSSPVVSDIFELISLWCRCTVWLVAKLWAFELDEVFYLFGFNSYYFWSSVKRSSKLTSSMRGILFLLLFIIILASSSSRAFYFIYDSLSVFDYKVVPS